MSAAPTQTSLNEGIQRFQDECSGLLTLNIVQPADLPHVVADAASGDAEAGRLLQQVLTVLDSIRSAPRRRPSLCAACPRPLSPEVGFAVVVAIPDRDDPKTGLALAICTHCGSDRASIIAKAQVGLRRIWPGLRPVTVTNPEGGQA